MYEIISQVITVVEIKKSSIDTDIGPGSTPFSKPDDCLFHHFKKEDVTQFHDFFFYFKGETLDDESSPPIASHVEKQVFFFK